MSDWYKITSATLWGNTVEISLYPSGCDTSQQPVALKAAAEPFEMETDDSTDIDTTIRETTGTVRFIVEDVGVLDEILPGNPFATKVDVQLTEIDTGLSYYMFRGYVDMSDYSQPYDGTPYEFELPVKDVLSMLSLVNVDVKDSSDFGGIHSFAYYLKEAIEAVGYSDNITISDVNIAASSNTDILKQRIQREWFLEEQTEESGGVTTYYVEGVSWHDAIDRVLKANAMTMTLLPRGRLLLQGVYPSATGRDYSWRNMTDFENGTPSASSLTGDVMQSISDVFVNMSNGNSVDWVQPLKRILVTQKLNETKIFELSTEWHSQWWLESFFIATDSSGKAKKGYDFTLFRSSSTQRGVTMQYWANAADDDASSSRKDISDVIGGVVNKALVWYKTSDTTYYTYGCLMGSLDTWGSDVSEVYDKTTLASPSPQLIILGQATAADGVDNDIKEVAEFLSPVIISTDKPGMICAKPGKLTFYQAEENSDISGYTLMGLTGEEYTNSRHPVLNYALGLIKKSDSSGRVYWYKEGAWVKSTSTTPDLSTHVTGWIFGNDGELAPNNEEWYDNSMKGHTKPLSTSDAKRYGYSFVGMQDRLLYKDGEGFFYPFGTDAGLESGEYQLVFKLYYFYQRTYIWVSNDNDYRVAGGTRANVIAILDGLELTFAPRCYDGALTSSGYGKLYDLPTEITTVFDCSGVDGTEEKTIELDSWKNDITFSVSVDSNNQKLTFTGKDNRTVQPALPVYDELAAYEWRRARKLITLDDARGEFTPCDQYKEDGGASMFMPLAFGWKASNEGGKKVFIEVI